MYRGIKAYVFNHFIKRLRVWGVTFESKLPAEFVITRHAEERMQERIGCKPEKMSKLVMKAWESKEPTGAIFINKQEYAGRNKHARYRKLMGYIYIFEIFYVKDGGYYQKRLITVFK